MSKIKIKKSQQWLSGKRQTEEIFERRWKCLNNALLCLFILYFWRYDILGLCSLRTRWQTIYSSESFSCQQLTLIFTSHHLLYLALILRVTNFLPNHPRVRHQVDTDYAPKPRLFKLAIPKPVFSSPSLENHSKGSCSYFPFPFLKDNNIFSVFSMTVILRINSIVE